MRGARRQQGLNKVRRALSVWRSAMGSWEIQRWPDLYSIGGEHERYMLYTRCPCSCLGCGNWRKHKGPTVQERKADESFAVQLEMVGCGK